MQVRTKSILGPVFIRLFFAIPMLAVAAESPVIGIVSASGHFTVDRSEVWGNTTLFEGANIETGSASSQVLSAAKSLSGDSHRLKSEVGKFLDSVRAA